MKSTPNLPPQKPKRPKTPVRDSVPPTTLKIPTPPPIPPSKKDGK